MDGASETDERPPFLLPTLGDDPGAELTCFLLASSWSMIPAEVVKMIFPNERAGKRTLTQFSMASKVTLNRGEMTPVLLSRPLSWMTIFPPRWSSMSSNSPM